MDIPWHWHDEFELGFVTGGCVVYQTNYHTFTLRQGGWHFYQFRDTALSAPGRTNSQARLQTQFLTKEFLAGASGKPAGHEIHCTGADQPWLDAIPFYHDDAYAQPVLARIQLWRGALPAERAFFELRLRSFVLRAVGSGLQFCREGFRKRAFGFHFSAENERMKKMMRYIQEHFREKMAVTSIAASVPVSERECYRLFQNHLGITPIEYISFSAGSKCAVASYEYAEKHSGNCH